MDKKVILAVAGAGKTYHICRHLNPNKRNLILAFTNENIHNIKRELINIHGKIPEQTKVTTFHSFVYHNFILPYELSIASHFSCPTFSSKGITTLSPPSKNIKISNSSYTKNPSYIDKKQIGHYITSNNQYYCDTLSELALQIKGNKSLGTAPLVKRAILRLIKFFDIIYVDEFQDFRQHNYDLLLRIAKSFPNIYLVGDYFQHSVSGRNNFGKPFKENTTYNSFIEELNKNKFNVDQLSLLKSRRCSSEVCDFVSNKLGINILSAGINKGKIIWVTENFEEILRDDNIVKLVYSNSKIYRFRSMNWSYSKGSTFNSVCLILTKKLENLDDDSFSPEILGKSSLNKLYVALTRSNGDLYLLKSSDFSKYKRDFLRSNFS